MSEGASKSALRSVMEAVAVVVVVGVLQSLASLAASMFAPTTDATLGAALRLQDVTWCPITISNRSGSDSDDLKVSVPADLAPTSILSSYPVKIDARVVRGASVQVLRISGVPPHSSVQVLVPTDRCADFRGIETKAKIYRHDELPNPAADLLRDAVFHIFVSFLLYLLFTIYFEVRSKQFEAKLSESRAKLSGYEKDMGQLAADIKKADARSSELNDEVVRVRDSYARQRLVLSRRLGAALSELDFWRDTVRKVVGEVDASRVLRLAVRMLGTYSTLGKAEIDKRSVSALAEFELELGFDHSIPGGEDAVSTKGPALPPHAR